MQAIPYLRNSLVTNFQEDGLADHYSVALDPFSKDKLLTKRKIKSHPGYFEIVLNLCLKAGRTSGGLSPDWSIGGCT